MSARSWITLKKVLLGLVIKIKIQFVQTLGILFHSTGISYHDPLEAVGIKFNLSFIIFEDIQRQGLDFFSRRTNLTNCFHTLYTLILIYICTYIHWANSQIGSLLYNVYILMHLYTLTWFGVYFFVYLCAFICTHMHWIDGLN